MIGRLGISLTFRPPCVESSGFAEKTIFEPRVQIRGRRGEHTIHTVTAATFFNAIEKAGEQSHSLVR